MAATVCIIAALSALIGAKGIMTKNSGGEARSDKDFADPAPGFSPGIKCKSQCVR